MPCFVDGGPLGSGREAAPYTSSPGVAWRRGQAPAVWGWSSRLAWAALSGKRGAAQPGTCTPTPPHACVCMRTRLHTRKCTHRHACKKCVHVHTRTRTSPCSWCCRRRISRRRSRPAGQGQDFRTSGIQGHGRGACRARHAMWTRTHARVRAGDGAACRARARARQGPTAAHAAQAWRRARPSVPPPPPKPRFTPRQAGRQGRQGRQAGM